jgi:hypothetical protein
MTPLHVRLAGAALAAAVGLVGCAPAADIVAADAPEPPPAAGTPASGSLAPGAQGGLDVDQPAVAVPEWTGPACTLPVNGNSARLFPARDAIETLGQSKRFRTSFTGKRQCVGPSRIVVFRMPNPAFDRAVRAIAREYGVRVEIRPAPVSVARMEAVRKEAHSRFEKLAEAGARPTLSWLEPEGYVHLGYTGDLAGARRVLKDLDDLPYVEVTGAAEVTPK